MVRTIKIKESVIDKNSEFNLKRFRIGNLHFDKPCKILDAKNLTNQLLTNVPDLIEKPIFETSKAITAKTIKKTLDESNDKKIRQIFDYKKWLSNYPKIISLTFRFNPFTDFEKIKQISGFFDYLYEFSDPILLIPNIKITKYDNEKKQNQMIIDVEGYLKYVDEAYQILNFKNEKPIFTPISLRFGIEDIKKIVTEYLKKENFYLWFDFEGSAITKPKIARIRAILREIHYQKRFDDIILYSTNIKREIISNPKSIKSPSSDVLASLMGANLIGVNKEPQRPMNVSLSREELQEIKKHKARVFDPESYYYWKLDSSPYEKSTIELLKNVKYNILFNSKLLNDEFKAQTESFLKDLSVKDYISNKNMIKEYKEGELINLLFQKRYKKVEITDWY